MSDNSYKEATVVLAEALKAEASGDELKDIIKTMSDGQFIALLDIIQAEGIKRAARAILDEMEAENEI